METLSRQAKINALAQYEIALRKWKAFESSLPTEIERDGALFIRKMIVRAARAEINDPDPQKK